MLVTPPQPCASDGTTQHSDIISYHRLIISIFYPFFKRGMGVVRCVRIDLFKAVLGFLKLDAAFMFPAGAKGGGAVPRRHLLDNIL